MSGHPPRWPVVVLVAPTSPDPPDPDPPDPGSPDPRVAMVEGAVPGDVEVLKGPLPTQPFDLTDRRLVRLLTIADQDGIAEAVAAAARGVSSVCAVALGPAQVRELLDEAARVATVVDLRRPAGRVPLPETHRQLLVLLRDGVSLTDAARALGWSRRTATRRLAEARDVLGVATTAEAVTRLTHDDDG